MEMHQLRYVVAVARTGNFSRAAEQCHGFLNRKEREILKVKGDVLDALAHLKGRSHP